jgi:hypothetical protein
MSNQGAASALSTTNVPISEVAKTALTMIGRTQMIGDEAEAAVTAKSFLRALADRHLVCIAPAELKDLHEKAQAFGAAKPGSSKSK